MARIALADFEFIFCGHGHYRVIYTSPSGKTYSNTTNNMILIDRTMNEEKPKIKDLLTLKAVCKQINY